MAVMISTEELLAMASEFTLLQRDPQTSHRTVTVRRDAQRDGSFKWSVIADGNLAFDRNGKCEVEPMPSSRTDEHIARFRFDTLCEALAAGRIAVEKVQEEWRRLYSTPGDRASRLASHSFSTADSPKA